MKLQSTLPGLEETNQQWYKCQFGEKNNFKSKRVEFRAPDSSANPYLAFSAIVAAGLDGINRKMDPGNPIKENIYRMSNSKRNSLGIKSLPSSLEESLEALKSDSDYLKSVFIMN